MKGFDVLKVKSAVKARNKFDLSRTHLTTMDFGQIVPLFAEELVPGDQFKVKADFFSRLAPLVKPTYGKFSFKTVSAFVPYFQVAEDCEAFFAGKTVWQGQTPISRSITIAELFNFILQYTDSTGASANSFDIQYGDANGSTVYTNLTARGKYYVKILNSLGYAIPQNAGLASGPSTWQAEVGSTRLSAYPILAFFKLYNDYMSQSQRFNSSTLSSILKNIQFNKTIVNLYSATTGLLTASCLTSMFTSLFLNYENDYFTSAWQSPNNAINSVENISALTVDGFSNVNSQVSAIGTSTTGNYANINGKYYLSQRALDFLKSFDDWVRRNNYSGSRAVQQVYSRFGVKTDDYRTHYAEVLSTDSMPVQVGDVTATADSANVPLGDYAGKGIMSGSKEISYNCSDYGILFIFGYFTVVPMMPYGFDRKVLRSSPLDWYNPEFDGLGADAIPLMEVYENAHEDDGTDGDTVFGFTERYNSYRYGRDLITGDFRDLNPNGDMNVWHTGRNLSLIRSVGNLVAQSSSMNTLPQTGSEYNRIFSVTSGDVDHFYLTAHFSVDAIRPMLNLNQVAQLGTGDTVVPRNGNVIS